MTVSVNHAQASIATTCATSSAVVAIAMARPTSPCNSSGSEADGVVNSTALRRLHFKSARNSRTRGPSVPKVVVMGSSTTSTSAETTINTSTESASTLVTNVTATDTSETCDSLDFGDTSGQSEPLLSSFDEPPTTVSIIAQPVNTAASNNNTGSGGGVGGRHASSSSGSSGSRNGSTASAQQVMMATTNGGRGSNSSGSGSNINNGGGGGGSGAPPHANEHNPITSSAVSGSPLLIHYDEICQATPHPPSATRTAPPAATAAVHFPFDVCPASPRSVRTITDKSQPLFTFCESPPPSSTNNNTTTTLATVHRPPASRSPGRASFAADGSAAGGSPQLRYLSKENLNLLRQTYDAKDKQQLNDLNAIRQQHSPPSVLPKDTPIVCQPAATPKPVVPDPPKVGNKQRFINSIMNMSGLRDRYGSQSKVSSAPVPASAAAGTKKKQASASATVVATTSFNANTSTTTSSAATNSTAGNNGQTADTTMFPFDREAIDYERIQRECFAVEDDDDDDVNNGTDDERYAGGYRRSGGVIGGYPHEDDGYEVAYETSLDCPIMMYERSYFGLAAHGGGGAVGANRKAGSSSRLEKFEYEMCEKQNYRSQQRSHSVFYPNQHHPNQYHHNPHTTNNLDAFTPQPSHDKQQPSTTTNNTQQHHHHHQSTATARQRRSGSSTADQLLAKFDQIASKFNQIPPKSLDAFNSHPHPSSAVVIQHQPQHKSGGGGPRTAPPMSGRYASAHQYHHQNSTSSSSSSPPTSAGAAAAPRETPMLPPNLRVDYFAATGDVSIVTTSASHHHHHQHQHHHHQQHPNQQRADHSASSSTSSAVSTASSSSSSADTAGQQQQQRQQQQQHKQQQQHHHQASPTRPSSSIGAGSINVTPNPLDTPVCAQPRATIVVQQASLSLDNTVETVLLRSEGDFISVEQGKERCTSPTNSTTVRKQKQREENMRQLLDVTNTYTTEELRDFEMRYGSPHHCRSQSVKTPGSRASGRPNQLCLPQQRSRVASMPNTGVEEEYYRLRHFSITGKGVVNRGDSLKSKRSRSNNSVASSNSSTEHLTAPPNVVSSARTSATCSLASSRESSTSNPGNGPYKVLMLGSSAVGKSSLVSQFMTSEYLHAYDTSIDDESGEKSVSVLLSGEESELVFIDHPSTEISAENCLSSYDPHGYCVIYSSADRESFVDAERVIQALWTSDNIAQRAVILVGNKADLARSRMVSLEEGKSLATLYECKFIETSVGINHNVDELLVGLLSQIRLKLENPEKSRDLFRKRSCRKNKRRACSPLGNACLAGNGGTNPATPVSMIASTLPHSNGSTCNGSISQANDPSTPPSSVQSSPRKYRGSRTSASLKVRGLLGRVWARDSKSKSCENLHVL